MVLGGCSISVFHATHSTFMLTNKRECDRDLTSGQPEDDGQHAAAPLLRVGLLHQDAQVPAAGRRQGLLRRQDRALLRLARLLHQPAHPAVHRGRPRLPLRNHINGK